jgi:hypothetical protein
VAPPARVTAALVENKPCTRFVRSLDSSSSSSSSSSAAAFTVTVASCSAPSAGQQPSFLLRVSTRNATHVVERTAAAFVRLAEALGVTPPPQLPLAAHASKEACAVLQSFLWSLLEGSSSSTCDSSSSSGHHSCVQEPALLAEVRAFLELEWLDGSCCAPAAAQSAVTLLLDGIKGAVASGLLAQSVATALHELVQGGGEHQLTRAAQVLQGSLAVCSN